MILWTIQREEAWRQLETAGFLRAAHGRIMEESWKMPYEWMIAQMTKRIGSPPTPGQYPVWAWLQWETARRARPDLRATGYLVRGERGVRIEFECPDSAALLSDFDLWHYVLNYWYLPETPHEGEQFEADLDRHGLSFFQTKPLPHPQYHQEIVQSWERIFDLDWAKEDLAAPRHQKSIQASIWEIRIHQVRDSKCFTAR